MKMVTARARSELEELDFRPWSQKEVSRGCRGCNVVVNYAGSKDAAEAVAKEIEAFGVKALAVKADTSNPDQVYIFSSGHHLWLCARARS